MKEQILKLRAEGKTYDEIKDIIGCAKSTVSYHCGEGQKEKSYLRLKNNRKKKGASLKRKIESFLKVNIMNFKKDTSKSLVNSSMSYKEAFDKIISNPYCYLTGRFIDLENSKSYHLDHIIPRSKGGSNEIDNMGLTCKEANLSKTYLSIEEYLALCKEVLEYNSYKVVKNKKSISSTE